MPYAVTQAEPGDMVRLQEICNSAFARNAPIYDLLYPDHWTPSGLTTAGARFAQQAERDPTATFLKAYDTETNEIVAMAKWHIYSASSSSNLDVDQAMSMPGFDGPYWESDEKRAEANRVAETFLRDRRAVVVRGQGKVVSLDILAVDPKFQRRDLGGMLVRWGTAKADELGVEATVESSRAGRGLYEKNGFVFEREVRLSVEGYEGPSLAYLWLVRPRKEKA